MSIYTSSIAIGITEMKEVFIVFGSFYPEYPKLLKVFQSEELATKYVEEVEKENYWDSVFIEQATVE